MKEISGLFGAIVGIALSVWGIMWFWGSVVTPLVPVNEWSGLIKLAIGFVIFWLGTGIVFLFIALMGLIFSSIASLFGGK